MSRPAKRLNYRPYALHAFVIGALAAAFTSIDWLAQSAANVGYVLIWVLIAASASALFASDDLLIKAQGEAKAEGRTPGARALSYAPPLLAAVLGWLVPATLLLILVFITQARFASLDRHRETP